MKTKTDFQAFGAAVAAWIAERTGEPVSASACADTLATGEAIITAARAGLRRNDIIIGVNRRPIASTAELRQLMIDRDGLLLNLLRGQEELVLMLR